MRVAKEAADDLDPGRRWNDQRERGQYQGLDRYEARTRVVAEMERLGHLVRVEDRDIELKHSDRSKTPVEPYLSDQWFVRMDDLAEQAVQAVVKGRVRFYPARYTKTYVDWLSEKRTGASAGNCGGVTRSPFGTVPHAPKRTCNAPSPDGTMCIGCAMRRTAIG